MIRTTLKHTIKTIKKIKGIRRNAKNRVFVEKIRFLMKNKSTIAVILGNGTSINNIDFSQLENTDLFVSNYFYKHPDYETLNIKLYFILDPIKSHWDKSKNIKYYGNFIEEAFRNKNLEKCIVRNDVYDLLSQHSTIIERHPEVLPYTPSTFSYKDFLKNKKYFKTYLPGIRHTPMIALSLAIQQGYSKILIGGLDHDFIKRRLEGVHVVEHFYPEKNQEMQHLLRPLSEEFHLSAVTFSQYEKIKEVADKYGNKIINISKESCLDMFEKGTIQDFK